MQPLDDKNFQDERSGRFQLSVGLSIDRGTRSSGCGKERKRSITGEVSILERRAASRPVDSEGRTSTPVRQEFASKERKATLQIFRSRRSAGHKNIIMRTDIDLYQIKSHRRSPNHWNISSVRFRGQSLAVGLWHEFGLPSYLFSSN